MSNRTVRSFALTALLITAACAGGGGAGSVEGPDGRALPRRADDMLMLPIPERNFLSTLPSLL